MCTLLSPKLWIRSIPSAEKADFSRMPPALSICHISSICSLACWNKTLLGPYKAPKVINTKVTSAKCLPDWYRLAAPPPRWESGRTAMSWNVVVNQWGVQPPKWRTGRRLRTWVPLMPVWVDSICDSEGLRLMLFIVDASKIQNENKLRLVFCLRWV